MTGKDQTYVRRQKHGGQESEHGEEESVGAVGMAFYLQCDEGDAGEG